MIIQTISAFIIFGITILFLNPTQLTMPDSVHSMMTVGLIIAFLTYAAYVLKEKPSDERDALHVLTAGRISYLVGVSTLIAGVVVQASHHDIDPWLVIVLCAMVLSKLLTRMYSHFKM